MGEKQCKPLPVVACDLGIYSLLLPVGPVNEDKYGVDIFGWVFQKTVL